jgi:serine protease AprX
MSRARRGAGVIAAVVTSVVTATVGAVPAGAPATAMVGVIVQGRSQPAQAAAAVRSVGGRITHALPIVTGVAATIPAAAVDTLRARPRIRAVTPDEQVAVHQTVTDNVSTVNSVFAREIGADRLLGEGIDGRGVRIALIDTGVTELDDVKGRVVRDVPDPARADRFAPCADFSGENTCNDSYGHGTFMAGLIAGHGAASGGTFSGVAPGAGIVSVKIAGKDGSADVSKVLAAIQYVVSFARDLNIRVLNLSLGTNSKISYRYDPLNLAVERAWRAGIAVVVSAGNLGPRSRTVSKPGDDPFVITVGAVDDRETPAIDDDRLPRFSARGPTYTDGISKPDVVAPGGRVVSLNVAGSFIDRNAPKTSMPAPYRRGSGTSMAAAVTSGAAALVLQANPAWTPDRLKFALVATARKVAERDVSGVGAGLIEAHEAARNAPGGLANQRIKVVSDGSGSLDGSRGDVKVTSRCLPFEQLVDKDCDHLHGDETANGGSWDPAEYMSGSWDGSSWYDGQWVNPFGTTWEGSSWYDNLWFGSSWQGSSWYGNDDDTSYGGAVHGSAWYGAWQ